MSSSHAGADAVDVAGRVRPVVGGRATAGPERGAETAQLAAVNRLLHQGRAEQAAILARTLVAPGLSTAFLCTGLDWRFTRYGKTEVLLGALLEGATDTFGSVQGAALALRLAVRHGQLDTARQGVEAHLGDAAGRRMRFGVTDYVHAFAGLGPEGTSLLRDLKYAALRQQPGLGLRDRAQAVAPAVEIEPPLARFLYERHSGPTLDFQAWEGGIRFGVAMDQLLRDTWAVSSGPTDGNRGGDLPWALEDVAPLDVARQILDEVPRHRGVLLTAYHGGQLEITRRLLGRLFPDAYVLGRGKAAVHRKRFLSIAQDARAALLGGLRALQDGNTLFMAPDGADGARKVDVQVLGRATRIGEGAAFLCFETGCPSFFFTSEYSDGRFVPRLARGPEPRRGEGYLPFRERWSAFYAGEVARDLTGTPQSIAFGPRWSTVLAGHPAPRGVPASQPGW